MCNISNNIAVYSVFATRPPPKHTHHVARETGKRTGRGCPATSSAFRSALETFFQHIHARQCLIIFFYFFFLFLQNKNEQSFICGWTSMYSRFWPSVTWMSGILIYCSSLNGESGAIEQRRVINIPHLQRSHKLAPHLNSSDKS